MSETIRVFQAAGAIVLDPEKRYVLVVVSTEPTPWIQIPMIKMGPEHAGRSPYSVLNEQMAPVLDGGTLDHFVRIYGPIPGASQRYSYNMYKCVRDLTGDTWDFENGGRIIGRAMWMKISDVLSYPYHNTNLDWVITMATQNVHGVMVDPSGELAP